VNGRRFLVGILFCLVACVSLSAQTPRAQTFTAEQGKRHIGETVRVCGLVVSPHYALKTRGRPTFLNFDRPYPHQVFTAVIWGSERAKFGHPGKLYRNKHVCVTGFISVFHGQPEMVLRSPKQVAEK
jgi:hypothetical protein